MVLSYEIPKNKKFIFEATRSELHKIIFKVAYEKSKTGVVPDHDFVPKVVPPE